jgi:hypothetical protein
VVVVAKDFGKQCFKDSDCGSISYACDTSSFGNQTFTCKVAYSQGCYSYDQCVDNLICSGFTCICVRFQN